MNKATFLTLIIFLLCFSLGIALSAHKTLWSDEIFTQVNTIDKLSVAGILRCEFSEGNLSPLFYLIQEGVSNLFQYQFPLPWKREFSIYEPRGQIILRLAPNLFMSLSIALLFNFFARNYSLSAAGLALITTFSSYMVWAYWVEARPYGLWFFLTTCQLLMFLSILRSSSKEDGYFLALAVLHVFLSLTIIFSVVQIILISAFLFFLKWKDIRKFVFLTVIPAGICYFYYLKSQGTYEWLPGNPLNILDPALKEPTHSFISLLPNLTRNIPLPWLMFISFYFILLVVGPKRLFTLDSTNRLMRILFALITFLLAAALGIMMIFHIWTLQGIQGQALSERYLIFLVPVGIILMTFISLSLSGMFKKDLWLNRNIRLGIFLVYSSTFLNTLFSILTFGIY